MVERDMAVLERDLNSQLANAERDVRNAQLDAANAELDASRRSSRQLLMHYHLHRHYIDMLEAQLQGGHGVYLNRQQVVCSITIKLDALRNVQH